MILCCVVLSMIFLCGCVEEPYEPAGTPTVSSTTTTATPTPTPKTELSLGESLVVNNISFTVVKYEFTESYEAGYEENYTYRPPEGAKYLWVYVKAKNVGELAYYAPGDYDVNLLYKGEKIIYKHPDPWFDEKAMYYGGTEIYPNVNEEGWTLYEVPEGIDISQAKVRVGLHTRTVTWSLTS
ncbi:MAG: hypothetical protein SYNGOMJ08_00459 [Candidatus Syntrophoarchaeum sp. GoM_oil]|nr:MAG: hypothetical protein SYNGOMJ08_00459 [Candidatus Syntrophoarchaeum sp. GoM_oil]